MNGAKIGNVQRKVLFGAAPATNDAAYTKTEISPAEQVEEHIQTSNPLYLVLLYYRYYMLRHNGASSSKYKSIVKFNLDHKAYFSKRDRLI